ncbi:MAG: hypothetical protein E7C36_09925 [Mixta calida]|uniref:Uncharacterized protein n=1 Tax=Mixta calida TaxID=665913 RepID=A0ABM6RYR4_9GAMM|nr:MULTISPECIES: hypothetical protein [Mixta]AIX74609.1 hypothetical protein PSNIH2_13065 [Pantoea sp. PSNIH2]MBS6056668.1 hypothetical protein [Pantoea sp.]POU49518.1 hypothetical protein C3380_08020 [Pantoea sp. PSNIH5]POU65530.1 hypothetical protein C3374_13795 [Pantoea sp. PSNIH4]POY67403.1 hypothetical protein C3402_12940 [Pantoea sp. PSNIH3]
MKKRIVILLLIIVAGVFYWRSTLRVTPEDQAYYAAIFCNVATQQTDNYLGGMRTMIEGSNSDYALHRSRFNQIAAERAITAWQSLTATDKTRLASDTQECQQAIVERLKK